MPVYRIFTNDRGKQGGVPLYSALKDVVAADPQTAAAKCPPQFTSPHYAPAVAIRWSEFAQSDDEKEWLRKHVDM